MIRTLRIIQANLNKSLPVQHALHNDESLQDFTAILGQEPNCFMDREKVVVPGAGRNWTCFTPPPEVENKWPVRSCIWVRGDLAAVQASVSCRDITAVKVTLGQRMILITSVYIPCTHAEGISPSQSQDQMRTRLRLLHELIEREKTDQPDIDVIVARDFNRHDTLWGGVGVGESRRQGEAEPIITFLDEHAL